MHSPANITQRALVSLGVSLRGKSSGLANVAPLSAVAAEQDGVSVEARRARTATDFTAAERVSVARHVHAEIRPASILSLSQTWTHAVVIWY